jgi:hypothetical protein
MRKFTVLLVLTAAAFILAACSNGSDSNKPTPPTTTTLSFKVNVAGGTEAHVVVQKADGTVLQSKDLSADDRQVSFNNVPAGALVTALAKTMGVSSGWNDPHTIYGAVTYPASYVANHTFFFNPPNTFSLDATISGPCPAGSDSNTEIEIWVTNYYFSAFCQDQGGGSFTFSGDIFLDSSTIQSNSDYSLHLLAATNNGSDDIAYAILLDRTPSQLQQGISLSAGDWKTDFGTNRVTATFPALTRNQWAYAYVYADARYQGQWLNIQNFSSSVAAGETSAVATGSYIPVSVGWDRGWRGIGIGTPKDDGNLYSFAETWDSHITLPINDTIALGTDVWPPATSLGWTDGKAPVLHYTYNGPAAAGAYATLDQQGFAQNIERQWDFYPTVGVGTSGTIAFPQLPGALAAYLPKNATSRQDYDNTASVYLEQDAHYLGETFPDSSNEVDIYRYYYPASSSSALHAQALTRQRPNRVPVSSLIQLH